MRPEERLELVRIGDGGSGESGVEVGGERRGARDRECPHARREETVSYYIMTQPPLSSPPRFPDGDFFSISLSARSNTLAFSDNRKQKSSDMSMTLY